MYTDETLRDEETLLRLQTHGDIRGHRTGTLIALFVVTYGDTGGVMTVDPSSGG